MEWYVAQDGRYTTVHRQARVDEMLHGSQELAAANREYIARIRLMLEFATKSPRFQRHLHRARPLSLIH
jgi:hypothetical protein